jgi:hypothetical protein
MIVRRCHPSQLWRAPFRLEALVEPLRSSVEAESERVFTTTLAKCHVMPAFLLPSFGWSSVYGLRSEEKEYM